MSEPVYHRVVMTLCSLCVDGAGGECHSPGCALWINRAPDLSLRDNPMVDTIDGAPLDYNTLKRAAKPPSAPPTAEPRGAGVSHAEARAAYASLNVDPDTGPLGVYIRQQAERNRAHEDVLASIRDAHSGGAYEDGYQAGRREAYAENAELERRARELCAELTEYRSRHQLIAYATNVTRAHDALAMLLGERSDSSED
jgi:hypothetical protein